MRLQSFSIGFLVAVCLAPAPAMAQDGASGQRGSSQTTFEDQVEKTKVTRDEAVGPLEQSVELNAAEKLRFAEKAVSEIQDGARRMSKAMEQAEKEKDPIKIQCISKKLSSTRALLEVSLSANARMKEAIQSGQMDRADHEFRKIAVALAKERQFLGEADACMGEGGQDAGQTRVEVVGETPELVDVTEPLDDPGTDMGFDPPDTSPFQ